MGVDAGLSESSGDDDDDDDAYDAEDFGDSDEEARADGDELAVHDMCWSEAGRTLAVGYGGADRCALVGCWDVDDGCEGSRAPRVVKAFEDVDEVVAVAVDDATDAVAAVGASPDGGGALYVIQGFSKRRPKFVRLDEDGPHPAWNENEDER